MRRWSAPLAAAAIAIVLAMVALYALSPHATRVKVGDLAPDLELPHWNVPTARGSLHEHRGSPVVLIFFDSSWPTSGAALQELEAVHRRFLLAGLVVVGVALDPPEEAKAVEFLLANRQITFTILLDPAGRQVGPVYGLPPARKPETYLIDATGRVVSVHLQAEPWRRDDMIRKLGALLPPRVPNPPPSSRPSPTPEPLDSPRPPG